MSRMSPLVGLIAICVFIPLSMGMAIQEVDSSEILEIKDNYIYSDYTTLRPLSRWIRNSVPTNGSIEKSPETNSTFDEPQFKPLPVSKSPPPCANGLSFCENIENYPSKYVEYVLKNEEDLEIFQPIFGEDVLESGPGIFRFGEDDESNSMCPVSEEVAYPKVAQTKDNKWMYIVNHDSFLQGVKIEKCMRNSDSEVQSCFFSDSFPVGYESECKQNYMYKKFVALNEEGKLEIGNFRMPSCCACLIKLADRRTSPSKPRRA